MSYDDVEIEDMEWSDELQAFTYPCPCGDLFQITKVLSAYAECFTGKLHRIMGSYVGSFKCCEEDLKIGEEIARCPSCSLFITVIYNVEDFQDPPPPQKTAPQKGAMDALIAVA